MQNLILIPNLCLKEARLNTDLLLEYYIIIQGPLFLEFNSIMKFGDQLI